MDSATYNLDELVSKLEPDWPSVSKRTIHFYASKGVIKGRRRGRGAEYNELDRLRLVSAVRMRSLGQKLENIVRRLDSMDREAIEKYLREPLPALPPRDQVRSIRSYIRSELKHLDLSDERATLDESRPATWSRIPLGDGVELALRTDVALSERLPGLIAALQNLAKH